MEIRNQESLEYKDIILKHKKSILPSRSEADITAKLGKHTFATPVVASNMKSILTREIIKKFDDRKWFWIWHRIDGVKDVEDFNKWASSNLAISSISIGVGEEWLQLLKKLKTDELEPDFITVDLALAWADSIIPIVDYIKSNFAETYLIVGNTANAESIPWFESLGVDCVKINVGTSSACRTRQYTSFGSATLGNLIECSCAAKNIEVMSDGGLTVDGSDVWIGDIAKALRFGASWLMSGVLFSKCIDSPSLIDGYRGNASADIKGHRKHVEGTNVKVETNGLTISEMMDLVEDSLRSSVSYAGGKDLSALRTVDFIDMRKC